MDPREAHVTGASQVCAPCPARHSAFNPSTAGILRLKRVCRFPLLGRLEGLILRLGPDGERPPGIALRGAYTLGSWVAVPTILGRELHLDDQIPTVIHGRRPPSAGLAGRAGCVLLAPINLEMLGVKAGLFAGCQ
jgi:hypothetical protein